MQTGRYGGGKGRILFTTTGLALMLTVLGPTPGGRTGDGG